MSRISTEQVIEILDEEDELIIAKHGSVDGVFVIRTRSNGDETMREIGNDLGELVNELHTRL